MSGEERTHPTDEMLAAFAQGRLEEKEAVPLADHLGICQTCQETILTIPDDRLLSLLRPGGGTPAPPPDLMTPLASHVDAETPPELTNHPRYRLLQRLDGGGMGEVYKAEHILMRRTVALKLINKQLTASPAVVERFRREMQAVALLSHPNLVRAYDADLAGELHFLVMELIDGVNLALLVESEGRLPVERACDYVRQAALGLAHAWKQKLVHRDIKPQNLMLTRESQIKVLDFGLASIGARQQSDRGLTAVDQAMGTPDYMAPEQIRDAHMADTRADIYSLGCTLYFLLTGRPPFPQGNQHQKMAAHLERQPEPLAALRPELSPDLIRVIDKMMAKDSARRFQTPSEVVAALEPFCQPQQKPAQRGWSRPSWIATGALLAVVGAISLALLPRRDPAPGPPPSKPEPAPGTRVPEIPEPQTLSLCDADPAALGSWARQLDMRGFRPVFLHAHNAGGMPRYTCLAIKSTPGFRWHMYDGEDRKGDIPKDMRTNECRPICGTSYRHGEKMLYASVWRLDGRVAGSLVFYPTPAEYEAQLKEMQQKKQRPAQVNGYPTIDGCGFAVIWEPDDGAPYRVAHKLTAEEYQRFLDNGREEKYRPISVSAYPHQGQVFFTAVLLQDQRKQEWLDRPGLTADQFRKDNEHWMAEGYRPLILSGYWQDNASRYLAVWVAR